MSGSISGGDLGSGSPERLPSVPALFLLAHHDDEIFIATTMRRLAARGPVSVAWLTGGGLGGRRRRSESMRAMEIMGIAPRNLFFFGIPDNRSLDFSEEIVQRVVHLLERLQPASVFVPSFEGGHQDHDTAQLAAAAAIASAGRPSGRPALYEFPLYHRCGAGLCVGSFPAGGETARVTPLKVGDRLFRRRLARIFRSQRPILIPLLGLRGGAMILHLRGEPYRRVPGGRDYSRRPHRGRLAYELWTRRRFDVFATAAGRLAGSTRRQVESRGSLAKVPPPPAA